MIGLLGLSLAAGACYGDEPTEPPKFYKLDFVVKEVSGSRTLNSRAYSTMVSTGTGRGEIRAGSKIPYEASTNNFQQIEVGVNIDIFKIREMSDRLAFTVVTEVSSVAEAGADQTRPTIRQNKWSSDVIVPLKKTTLLFSSDNVDAKSLLEVEVTVTPVP